MRGVLCSILIACSIGLGCCQFSYPQSDLYIPYDEAGCVSTADAAMNTCKSSSQCTGVVYHDGCYSTSVSKAVVYKSDYVLWLKSNAVPNMTIPRPLAIPSCGRHEYLNPNSVPFCNKCPVGTSCETELGTCLWKCRQCVPGTAASQPGTACKLCSQHYYSDTFGASACTYCAPPKHANSKEGAFQCSYNPVVDIIGSRGPRGKQGPQGARGEMGETGGRGGRGLTGERGATGRRGEQGAQGAQGAPGAKGKDDQGVPQGAFSENSLLPVITLLVSIGTGLVGVLSVTKARKRFS